MTAIAHDTEQQHFVIAQDHTNEQTASESALLQYRMLDDHLVDFYRTYVPPSLRNKGLAEKLVRHGLAWAQQQGFTIQASCWYVDKFLR